MDDAADAQDELKEALHANTLEKVAAPAMKIEELIECIPAHEVFSVTEKFYASRLTRSLPLRRALTFMM